MIFLYINKCIKVHRTSRFGCDFYKFHIINIYFSTFRAPVMKSSQTCVATKYSAFGKSLCT